MAHAVQSEWIFLQCVNKDTVQALMELENFLWETFLPCLLFGKSKTLPPIVGALSKLPVKKSEMGLQSIMTSSKEKYTSLLRVRDNIIDAFKDKRLFSTTNHIKEV